LSKLFALVRGAGFGELALGLRRFLPRPPAASRGSPAGRLAATFGTLRHSFFLTALCLRLAALAVLETGGALLVARLLALLLRIQRLAARRQGRRSDGRWSGGKFGGLTLLFAWPGRCRRKRRPRPRRGRSFIFLFTGAGLVAALGDADYQQEQQDCGDETGDEVLDVVADEVASLAREGLGAGLGRCNQGHRECQ
jgi:hypothetical protein